MKVESTDANILRGGGIQTARVGMPASKWLAALGKREAQAGSPQPEETAK